MEGILICCAVLFTAPETNDLTLLRPEERVDRLVTVSESRTWEG
jgi:hypothetical protein